jgi:hypothetical protein
LRLVAFLSAIVGRSLGNILLASRLSNLVAVLPTLRSELRLGIVSPRRYLPFQRLLVDYKHRWIGFRLGYMRWLWRRKFVSARGLLRHHRVHVELSSLLGRVRKLARDRSLRYLASMIVAGGLLGRGCETCRIPAVLANAGVILDRSGRGLAGWKLERLALLTRDLCRICAPKALELQVFADGVFEQSHCAAKPYCAGPRRIRLDFSVRAHDHRRTRTGL